MPPPPSPTVIARRAAACNNRVRGHHSSPPLPVEYRTGGSRRLTRLVRHFHPLLDLHANTGNWKRVLRLLGFLAVEVRDGVYRGRGAETAAMLVLTLLGDMGFTFQGTVTPTQMQRDLSDAILDGDERRVAMLIWRWYSTPP